MIRPVLSLFDSCGAGSSFFSFSPYPRSGTCLNEKWRSCFWHSEHSWALPLPSFFLVLFSLLVCFASCFGSISSRSISYTFFGLAMEYMCVQVDLPYDSHALYRVIRIQQTLNLMPAGLAPPHHDLRIITPDIYQLFGSACAIVPTIDAACVMDDRWAASHGTSACISASIPLCYHGVSVRSLAFTPYSRPRIFRRFPHLASVNL